MPAKKPTQALTKSMFSASPPPERFKLGEMGNLGLRVFNGVTQGELRRELNFPNNLITYKEMQQHSTVNASLTLFETIIGKAEWTFKEPVKATAEEKEQCRLINEMMQDMEHSWSAFILDALSANSYGFCVNEKVYRRRYKSNGSLYDDGIIGWKKLPIRSQESIQRFVYSPDGNDIIGVYQNLSRVMDVYGQYGARLSSETTIPLVKIMHFRVGRHRGDPFGKSPLRDAYLAWKYLTALEEMEATGVIKDLNGLPVLYMPAQYLQNDADPEVAKIRLYYENALRNIQTNEQAAIILPQMFDAETRQPMFKLELLSDAGKKNYDITKIKEWYKNLIMISLSTDILTMGQSQVGSFALGSIKNSLAGSVAMSLASNIADTINRDLIRQTYELNKWDTSRMGFMDFDNLIAIDTEAIASFWQRTASVGLVEADRAVLNAIRVSAGVDPLPDDLPPQKDLMKDSSKAGEGMATGMGNGTAKTVAGTDTSVSNTSNVA